MNNQNIGFYVDVGILVTGLIILVAFLAFPFIGLAGLGGLTPLQIVSLSNLANEPLDATISLWPIFMIAIAICALLASIAAGIALGKRNLSRVISYGVMALGAVVFLILLVFLFQLASTNNTVLGDTNGLSVALSVMGFGYWLIFLGSIVLIIQVFFGRVSTPAIASSVPMSSPPPPMSQVMRPPQRMSPPMPQAQAPARAYVNAWLINLASDQSYQLFQGDTRIGRSRERNDVVLSSPSISREHLIIRQEGQHYVAYGTGSRVPPYINGQALQGKQVLNSNDEIVLGDMRLRFIRN